MKLFYDEDITKGFEEREGLLVDTKSGKTFTGIGKHSYFPPWLFTLIGYKNGKKHGKEKHIDLTHHYEIFWEYANYGGRYANCGDSLFTYPYEKYVHSETNWKNGVKHGLDYHHGWGGTECYPYRRFWKNGYVDGISDSFHNGQRMQSILEDKNLIEIRYFTNSLLLEAGTDFTGFIGEFEGHDYVITFKDGKDFFELDYDPFGLKKI